MYTPNKYPKLDNITDAYLWHCKLNHMNENRINRLAQEGILNINIMNYYQSVSFIFLER